MVKLDRIYTRGGDKGKTSLGDGKRVFKHHIRLHTIGDVDELNSAIGVAKVYAPPSDQEILSHIQNDLFDVGADLCIPLDPSKTDTLRVVERQVTILEEKIDFLTQKLNPLRSFVLPGGSELAAHLYLARAIARRAERNCVCLSQEEEINPFILQYLNRLSDFLFVLARFANDKGRKDVLWAPGANR